MATFWNKLFGTSDHPILEVETVVNEFVGGSPAKLDYSNANYLQQFSINPILYAVITAMADKTASVPMVVKKVKDQKARAKLRRLQEAHKGSPTARQFVTEMKMAGDAFDEEELDFPLERPNPYQTWTEFLNLYKVYLKLTGNVFIHTVTTTNGINAGVPQAVYLLFPPQVKIVVPKNPDWFGLESPIDGYVFFFDGTQKEFTRFEPEEIIHIKYANPLFSNDGAHLYGLSPIKSALLNVDTSKEILENNRKTAKNGGVYGFIHGKNTTLTSEQADSLKQRLVEMDKSPERLARIAGATGDVAFTRISLTTDELKPFDYIKNDQKIICNVLKWSDNLLNNDDGGRYDKQVQERKRMITDNIIPDLQLLSDALNQNFIKRFPGYQDAELTFDPSELAEMQEDMKLMVEWMEKAPLTPNEKRLALKYGTIDAEGMDVVWMPSGLKRSDDTDVTTEDFNKALDAYDRRTLG